MDATVNYFRNVSVETSSIAFTHIILLIRSSPTFLSGAQMQESIRYMPSIQVHYLGSLRFNFLEQGIEPTLFRIDHVPLHLHQNSRALLCIAFISKHLSSNIEADGS